jgi:hypothetical protein
MLVNMPVLVSVNINASANPVCQGTSVLFTATPVNGGSNPSYQWKVNGTSVGNNSTTFTYVPVNNDVVTCTLVSNASCVAQNTVNSNQIYMTVNSVPAPPVITVLENTLFSSSPVGNSWYYSGNMIPGANGSSYVATQNGLYWAIVTINECSSDTSNNINLTLGEIENVENAISAVLYPNPNNGRFVVKINNPKLRTIDLTII